MHSHRPRMQPRHINNKVHRTQCRMAAKRGKQGMWPRCNGNLCRHLSFDTAGAGVCVGKGGVMEYL